MSNLPTPSFIIDTERLEENLKLLAALRHEANCKIVLSLKAFSLWHTFPLVGKYLDGCSANGVFEAQLSHEAMGKATVVHSPAYQSEELDLLLDYVTHLNFNSASQWLRFKDRVMSHPRFKTGELRVGMRINPEHSTAKVPSYDPCGQHSRFGATKKSIRKMDFEGITGLHFHTLYDQHTDDLESTLEAIDHRFADILMRPQVTWLNIGGGQCITKSNYNRKKLEALITKTKSRYNLEEIWLEPGKAVVHRSGTLEASVLDIVENKKNKIAILDTFPSAHMPDTLHLPYRPELRLSSSKELAKTGDDSERTYYLGGSSCSAADFVGPYCFERELSVGDRLTFEDIAPYTMVKTTTFNGVKLPSIVLKSGDSYNIVRSFGYDDFKARLG
jgi:carboxynorspermidine decarboxylase